MEKKAPGALSSKRGMTKTSGSISGSAYTTDVPSPTLSPRTRGLARMRSKFEDQSGVGPVYRWTSGRFSR
jgi:hypothetical protein